MGSLSLLQGIFPTQVSRIAGGFFTSWATREALLIITFFNTPSHYPYANRAVNFGRPPPPPWNLFIKCQTVGSQAMSQSLLLPLLTFTVRLYVHFSISYLLQYKRPPAPQNLVASNRDSVFLICLCVDQAVLWAGLAVLRGRGLRQQSWVCLLWASHPPGSLTWQLCSKNNRSVAPGTVQASLYIPLAEASHMASPRFTRRVVFHLEKTGVGTLGCKQACILGWETSVVNFCHLPHLSLIKPLGFTNVVSPGFEIYLVVVSKLR